MVAATFAVFNPAVVVASVAHGWTLVDAATIQTLRTQGAVAQLTRILGAAPEGVGRAVELLTRATEALTIEGRPLFAGLVALGLPGDPLADAWRLADRLREQRGDAHVAAWTAAGVDAPEVSVLTEVWWGLRPGSYSRSRAWGSADLAAATERLTARGLLDSGGELTGDGRSLREQIEAATDHPERPAMEALGEDLDELLGIVGPWSRAVKDAAGYPPSGPHDLAGAQR